MHQNTERLHRVMKRAKLTNTDVAGIVNRRPTTVSIWRCASDNRVIPAELLKLVELTASTRKQGRK